MIWVLLIVVFGLSSIDGYLVQRWLKRTGLVSSFVPSPYERGDLLTYRHQTDPRLRRVLAFGAMRQAFYFAVWIVGILWSMEIL